jgi:hypothetical protein
MIGVLKPGVRLLERFSFARKFQLVFVSLWVIAVILLTDSAPSTMSWKVSAP